MSDLSTVSILFEEVKQYTKQILSYLEKPKNDNSEDRSIDLSEITNHVNQSKDEIISKLEQIAQVQSVPKKVHHRISIDIKYSWVSFALVGLFLSLVTTLCLCYKLKQVNNQLIDNDLKYRYIKAFNKADTISIYKLENVFEYNRSPKAIIEIRKSVEQYEQDVIDRARRLEQAKLKEEEARILQDEASKLKSK